MTDDDPDLSKDILRGADELAEFLFGSKTQRRKVYHLVATSKLPVFKLGSMICGRKSIIVRWIEAQETRILNDNQKPEDTYKKRAD